MKLTIVLGLLVVLQVVSSAEKYGSLDEEWEKYKVDFEKHYSSAEEEAKRKAIFGKTLEQVKEHNKRYDAGEVTYSMGLNAFSDLNPDEVPTGLLLSKGN
ncbi:crustapain-like [Hermetia illucens]|uniref:crustapain-like n=1 Tax=Hermetia illucens TaxID=343691 RepID=UPI0018CBFF46|nr:crustapain-like [Hermetia illucens]